MPISDIYKFIFVHVHKTGGSSIEKAFGLSASLDEDREKMFGFISSSDLKAHGFLSSSLQHLTIHDLRLLLDSDILNSYFSFAFVRNPWDKIVSSYFRKDITLIDDAKKAGIDQIENVSFEEFVHTIKCFKSIHLLPQYKFVADDSNNLLVDFVGRFENFKHSFNKLCSGLHIENVRLPYRPIKRHAHYSSYYTKETRDIVASIYKKDIDLFSYGFDRPSVLFHIKFCSHKTQDRLFHFIIQNRFFCSLRNSIKTKLPRMYSTLQRLFKSFFS